MKERKRQKEIDREKMKENEKERKRKKNQKQGRIHENPCRGQLGRGSNNFGRGMLKYKLAYP